MMTVYYRVLYRPIDAFGRANSYSLAIATEAWLLHFPGEIELIVAKVLKAFLGRPCSDV